MEDASKTILRIKALNAYSDPDLRSWKRNRKINEKK